MRKVDQVINDLPGEDRTQVQAHGPQLVAEATPEQRTGKRREAVRLVIDGAEVSLAAFCEERGIPYQRTYVRLKRGWPLDRAVGEPGKPRNPPRRIPRGRIP